MVNTFPAFYGTWWLYFCVYKKTLLFTVLSQMNPRYTLRINFLIVNCKNYFLSTPRCFISELKSSNHVCYMSAYLMLLSLIYLTWFLEYKLWWRNKISSNNTVDGKVVMVFIIEFGLKFSWEIVYCACIPFLNKKNSTITYWCYLLHVFFTTSNSDCNVRFLLPYSAPVHTCLPTYTKTEGKT